MSTWMVFFALFYVSYLSFHLLCHFVILWSYTTKAIKIICGNQPHHHGATNREKETVQDTAYCVSCIFTANDALYFFFRILHSLSHIIPTYSTWSILHSLFTLSFFANSPINPVLYAFRIPEFRRALFPPFRCRWQPEPVQVLPLNDQ